MRQWLRSSIVEPNKGVIMELSGFKVTPGSPTSFQRSEEKKSDIGFPHGNQSRCESDERTIAEIGVNIGYHGAE